MADSHSTRDWRIALFQAAAVAGLLCGAVLMAATARAGTSTIGRTWPIAEPDAMSEIEAAVARQPASMAQKFGPRSQWTALKGATLGITRENRARSIVPFYTLDQDIRLADGKLIYPKGFTFNPLTYVSLPQRLVIVHPRDLDWALKTATLSDWILLTGDNDRGGRDAQDDALSLGEKHGRALFILEERVKQRLGLTVAPVIVRQVGTKLELTEIEAPGRRKP